MEETVKKISTNNLDDLFSDDNSEVKNKRIHFPFWKDENIERSSSHSKMVAAECKMRPPSIMNPITLSEGNTSCSSSCTSSAYHSEDEYGYYDEFVEEPGVRGGDETDPSRKSLSASRPGSCRSMPGSCRSIPVTPVSKTISRSSSSVICLYEDDKPTLTCRSFETVELNEKVMVFVAMSGIRIIEENYNEIPEYKLKIMIDQQEFIAWKRFQDFSSLGEACRIHMKNSRSKSKCSLKETVIAWKQVLNHRPWWVRPTSVKFLVEELALLENFMQKLLFEIPCIEMLVEFVI